LKETEHFKKQTGPHTIALNDVIDRLFKAGCAVAKTGFEHMQFTDGMTKMIRGDPMNMRWLRVRGFPDLEVFPERVDIETFYIDVKTIQNKSGIAYPEAFPWADSIERSVFKAKKTLYVYYLQNGAITTRKCFFTDNHTVIDSIFGWRYRESKPLPSEAELMIQNYLNSGIMNKTSQLPPYGVSGDCAAMIHERDLLQCTDFDEFIKIHLLS
jgi:hypothetical protein